MRKNGFTLIELLAVIVILATIALIATPIILGIINDAREESNERSVELYASAVRNAIAAYQLTGTSAPTSFEQLNIQYDGDVKCAVQELYEDGSFYLEGCKVNDSEKEYSYGEKQVAQVHYYSVSSGSIGGDLPSDAKENLSELDRQQFTFYLKLDVDSNRKVSGAYVCFERNETEYCLKGNDSTALEENKKILLDAFKTADEDCTNLDTNPACYSCHRSDYFACWAYSYSDGEVFAGNTVPYCRVNKDGTFECYLI